MQQVEKALKFNPQNTELLAQKQELLNQTVANTKNKLETLKAAQEKVEKAFKANEEWERQYAPIKEQIDSTSETLKKLKSHKEKVDEKFQNGQISAKKYEEYNKKVTETEQKLKELQKAKKDLDSQFTDGHISAEEYREFRREVVTTESNLNSLETQLEETNSALNRNGDEAQQSNKKHKTLKESFENLKSKAAALKENLHNAIEKLKAFGEAAKKVATASLQALETGIKSVTSTLSAGVNAFAKYTQSLGVAATAAAGFAVKSGASFETSMSKVQSLSGATGDDFKRLEEKAKEMGASTSKSATESADALGYMALAGWDTEQMLAGLEPILRASEAGAMDLATCSDLVTDSMAAMGRGTDELNHYLDVVSKTQASANTSMQQMLEAYVGCGGTLKNLEIPLETSATLIGVLANRGIKGSEAGTSLNSVLVNLMGAGGKAADALDLLGVSMYENGKRKDITVMLTELNQKLKACSDDSRDAFTAMIGGKTQMDTLQALLAGLDEEYGDLNKEINNCNGYMSDAAKTMQNNVQGAFTALQSAAEGAGIAIYGTFKDNLKDSIQEVTSYISGATELIDKNGLTGLIHAFNHVKKQAIEYIIKSIPEIVQTISESAAVFNSSIITVIDIVSGTLPQASEKILPVLFRSFFSIIDKIIKRIPEIVPQIISFGTMLISGIADGMLKSANKLIKTFPRIFRLVIPVISKTIPEIFSKGTEIITTLADSILKSIPTIINAVKKCAVSIVSNLINSIILLIPQFIETGLKLLVSLLDGIISALPQIISTIKLCISSLIQIIMEKIPDILQTGVEILMAIINGIIDMLPQLISTAVDLLLIIVDTLLNNLDLLIEAALKIVIALCVAILDNIDKIFEYIPKLIKGIVKAIIDNLDMLIKAAIEILVTIGAALVSCVSELIPFIPQVIDAIVAAFKDTDWKQTGRDILEAIFDGIIEIGDKASDVLKPVVNKISEFINEGIRGINDLIDGLNSASIGGISFKHIPEIPMLAKGGIVSSGSAIVGEAGAELLTVANGRAIVQPLMNSNSGNSNIKVVQPVFDHDVIINTYMYPSANEFTRTVVNAGQLNAAMTGGR